MIRFKPRLLDPARARVLDIPKDDRGQSHDLIPHTSLGPGDDVGDAGGQFVGALRHSSLPALLLIKPSYVIFS